MRAFRYDTHGDLVPCPDYGAEHRERVASFPVLTLPAPTSKRERRRWARRGSGRHRHRARPVREVEPFNARPLLIAETRLRGHEFSDGHGVEVRLYLLDDAKVTRDDEARLNAVIRGAQQPGKPSRPLTAEAVIEVLRAFGSPRPKAITVSADLHHVAAEIFEPEWFRTAGPMVRNPLAGLLSVEVDHTLPNGRWKISRPLDEVSP